MKARLAIALRNVLPVVAALVLGLGPGCSKEEKKPEQPEAPKKAEVKPEAKPADAAKPAVKEEPARVAKEPTPAEKLAAALTAFPAYTTEAGKVEKHLADLKEFAAKNPGTPEAAKAALVAATVRTDFLVLAAVGKYPGMAARLMGVDDAAPAAAEPTPDELAQYCKSLSAQFQEQAAAAAPEAKAVLADMSALLFYMSQDVLEAAGKLDPPKLVLPPEWLVSPAAALGTTSAPSVSEGSRVVPPAPAAAPAAAPAPAVAEKKAPYLVPGGADVGSLVVLARSATPVAWRARVLIASRLATASARAASTVFSTRWVEAADAAGPLACAACGNLAQVPPAHLGEVVLMTDNAGIVCRAARADLDGGMPLLDAVRKSCLPDLFLTPDDALVLTADNALPLRFFALAAEFLSTAGLPADDPFAKEVQPLFAQAAAGMQEAAALEPPVQVFPKEEWEAVKDRLVLQSDLSAASPDWEYQPLEVVTFDENGVGQALRPVAAAGLQPRPFADRASGLRFPGKTIIDNAGIQKEIDEKHAEFKARGLPFDQELNAYLEEVTIRGVKFMKPHFAIPSVIKALDGLTQLAGGLEVPPFRYLAGRQVLNSERPQKPDYKDTVGKAMLMAVDRLAPALLFKRVLDSMYYVDARDSRLLKGAARVASVPTVYFTEKFVDVKTLDTTYKRPILVYVTEGGRVSFYPPTDITRKGKMTAKRNPRKRDVPWRKYSAIEDPRNPDPVWNLFMAYTSAASPKFEEEVAGIAAQMKSKWDNGNVFYVIADDNALSGHVVKVADLLARLPEDQPIAEPGLAFPGLVCDPAKDTAGCFSNIVVLFPDVEVPYLPGKKKIKEVETNVYCDQKDIAAKINAKRGAIKFCYDPELQKNPALKGKVIYKFTIDADGKVKEISVEADGLGNAKVVDCVLNIIRKISFRRPIGGECVIRYPYMFQP